MEGLVAAILEAVNALVLRRPLSDTFLLDIVTMVLPIFFLEDAELLQLRSVDLVTEVCSLDVSQCHIPHGLTINLGLFAVSGVSRCDFAGCIP